jgi:Icc protein
MRNIKNSMFKFKTAFSVGAILLLAVIISACSAPAAIVSQPVSASGAQMIAVPQSSVSDRTAVIANNASPTQGSTTAQAVPVNPQSNVNATTQILNPGVVSWVHIGDLHITTADQQNYADFKTILANTDQYLKNGINFVYLPGDNANDGTESEYQLIKQATDQLQVPLYAIPGDHDEKGISLYKQYMEPVLYQSFTAGGYHFVLLDMMNGISSDEQTWMTNDLDAAAKAGLKSVVFMHTYNNINSALQDLIQKDNVIVVDTGHTHYNDVANDGHTIYAATRSTGQATEGPVGFSITNLDNGVISWKFKQLGSFPFVMITSPSDKQLIIDSSQAVKGTVDIRAKIWDDKGVAAATMQIDGGAAVTLQQIGDTQMWSASFDSTKVSNGDHKVTVNVTGAGGNTSEDTITMVVDQAGSYQVPQRSFGASGNSIGAYSEKGLLGNHTSTSGGPSPQGGPPAPPKGP